MGGRGHARQRERDCDAQNWEEAQGTSETKAPGVCLRPEGRTMRGEAGEGEQVSIRWDIVGHGKDFGFYPKQVKCH